MSTQIGPGPGTRPSRPGGWMPVTAGILSIVAGGGDLLTGLIALALRHRQVDTYPRYHVFVGTVFGAAGVLWVILAVIAIVGGVFAIRRRAWGLALAGAICAVIWPTSILGILAIIFVALSRPEFN